MKGCTEIESRFISYIIVAMIQVFFLLTYAWTHFFYVSEEALAMSALGQLSWRWPATSGFILILFFVLAIIEWERLRTTNEDSPDSESVDRRYYNNLDS